MISSQQPTAGVSGLSVNGPNLRQLRTAQSSVPGVRRIAPALLSGLAQAIDCCLLVLVGLALTALWVDPEDAFADNRYFVAVGLASLLTIVLARRLDLYAVSVLARPTRFLPKLLAAWSGAMLAIALSLFLLKVGPDFSRGWLMLWFVSAFAAAGIFHVGLGGLVRRWTRQGLLKRTAVILGAGPESRPLIEAIQSAPDSDVRICGVFDDRYGERISPTICGHVRLGNVDGLIDYCRTHPVDLLIVSLPITAESRILQILKKLWVLPVDIRLAAHRNRLRFRPRAYSFLGDVPLLDLFDKPLREWDSVLKSTFDRTIALLALIALAPLMAAIALAVRLDSKGPILFRQKRLGFNNEVIEVLKFRSMYVEATDCAADKLVCKGDPRVTRVGRFIRKTSLDELPQLFNVLGGTLSLVGPRPHALHAKAADKLYHEAVDGYFARHKVKPGITGWAQVNGWRGETDTPEKLEKRVEHDLYYIENWSLLFDIYILARTPFALLRAENAY